MATVYDNQRECGDLIVKAFGEQKIPNVLLLAQMQMGKSGTYWYVIFKMLFDPSNGIENVIIMSGNREKELYAQVLHDHKQYTKWFLNNHEETDRKKLRMLKQTCEDKIHIMWGSHLVSKKKPMVTIKNNTLLVWDEAHYAQSKNN